MSLGYAELERFYEDLVTRARADGITCAITSGMACVAYGIAETTRDCDLLCAPDAADRLLNLLSNTHLFGQPPSYRGNLSSPLDARWLPGGWTSHFIWKTPQGDAYLDVFGVPPRGTEPWQQDIQGFYAGAHTVAEMKRTNRGKDWPFVTALGVKLLEARDPRGWLHIYDEEILLAFRSRAEIPREYVQKRPVLELVETADRRVRGALQAEIHFWHELDRIRLRIYEKAVRPYMAAVRKAQVQTASLQVQHQVRIACAEKHLAPKPLLEHGAERMIAEAREDVTELANPERMRWLPDVHEYFIMAL